ncbi:inositol transporter 4 [Senna tora]|uniref:Inositol transporter 4 n=1 Tax=Senna tora TaxID=362788 RepID=A0A834W2X7_9FABA|nr:inositol transporter 4 [Senna tora]
MDPCKLFIGGISWDTNEDRLRQYFQKFGDVVEAVIMKDRTTGRARGFGFIVFSDPCVADLVVMERHVIDGRTVEAKKAVPRDDQNILNRCNSGIHGSPGPSRTKKIFVGGLASSVTESDFKKYFDQFGTITDVVVMYDHNTQRPRGFGFITYDSEEAVEKVLYKSFHELNGKMVEVKRAVPKELSSSPSRGQLSGYNYGLSRVSSFSNGCIQGYSPSVVGGHGLRTDGRFSPVTAGRSGYPSLSPSYGSGLTFDPELSQNGNTNFTSTLILGRELNPSYNGSPGRYSNAVGYAGKSGANSSILSLANKNWGNGSFNCATNLTSSDAFDGYGSENPSLGSFSGVGALWNFSPITNNQAGTVGSGYGKGSLSNGCGDVNFGSKVIGYGKTSETIVASRSSYALPNSSYDGAYKDIFDAGSFYGDHSWRASPLELEDSGSLGYGLGDAVSDLISRSSSRYIGAYEQSDRGVISGALLYIRDDFQEVDKKIWLQENIVSVAIAAAIMGAALGGWMTDKLGRKKSILVADVVFIIGALVMALAPSPLIIILGRIFVGLGVGMASMTAPLYISEASPANIRGALVSTNAFLITLGQFLSYLINLAFTKTSWTWRGMLGVAAIPALIQFILMCFLPESPRWLYRQGKEKQVREILVKIYPADEVEDEIRAMQESIKAEEDSSGNSFMEKLKSALSNTAMRRALYAGVAVQVIQQFVGINTVMYYSPTIVQFAGIASNSTALALSLVTSGLNVVGTILSMFCIDRFGRRRLMLVSNVGIIFCLIVLSGMFFQAAQHAPAVSNRDTLSFGGNNTCEAYVKASDFGSWNCMTCLKAECAFCANTQDQFLEGACLGSNKGMRGACGAEKRVWYSQGCPSKIGIVAVLMLGVYILAYSPGMGNVPWVLNSEIYPQRLRGLGGGIAAVANWSANLIVSESFLSMIKSLGAAGTFIFFAVVSFIGLVVIYLLVPETKGLHFQQVQELLHNGFTPFPFDMIKHNKHAKFEGADDDELSP